jgi:hypothetical protein
VNRSLSRPDVRHRAITSVDSGSGGCPDLVNRVGDRSDDEVRVAAVDEVVARLGMQVNAALRQESQLCLELLPDGLGIPRPGRRVLGASGDHGQRPPSKAAGCAINDAGHLRGHAREREHLPDIRATLPGTAPDRCGGLGQVRRDALTWVRGDVGAMSVSGTEADAQPGQPKRAERELGNLEPAPRPGKAPAAASLAEPVPLVRMAGVDQHEPSHLLGVARGVQPHMEATDRVAYQDIWRRNSCGVEQGMEIIDDPLARGPWAWVAPAKARPVIQHHGGVLG